MRAVGIRELKNKLRTYIRLAEAGERVLISDRNHVVAELGPPEPTRAPKVVDAILAELFRKGLIQPPLKSGPYDVPPPAKPLSLKQILTDLDADRDDR